MGPIHEHFIRAERTGNWKLHLQSIQAMLPYMAASGHNSYTKSGMLYLQQMLTEAPNLISQCSAAFQ